MTLARPIPTDAFSTLSQHGTPIAARVAVRFAVVVTKWAARRRTRLALSQLEPWQLSDVGLTPDDVQGELRRVFWRL